MKSLQLFFVVFLIVGIQVSCDKDDNCKETYNGEVKAIVDRSCAYAGCHNANDPSMWIMEGSENYNTYAGILANLQSGAFRERALDSLDMPPKYTPDGRPKTLTQEELRILTCWLDSGHPEN